MTPDDSSTESTEDSTSLFQPLKTVIVPDEGEFQVPENVVRARSGWAVTWPGYRQVFKDRDFGCAGALEVAIKHRELNLHLKPTTSETAENSIHPPRYRDSSGRTWSGRGPRPSWLKNKDLARFAIGGGSHDLTEVEKEVLSALR